MKILEAIEEWRGTICQTSRYKEDLGFIRDMHRLLSYKGYVFPEVRREDAAVLNPSDVSTGRQKEMWHLLTPVEPQICRGDGGRRESCSISKATRVDSAGWT